MTHLSARLTLHKVTFAHRAWMSPMAQFHSVPDGDDTWTPRTGICSTWARPRGRCRAGHGPDREKDCDSLTPVPDAQSGTALVQCGNGAQFAKHESTGCQIGGGEDG